MTTLDFAVANHGSIHLLIPRTEEAREWVELHLPDDAQRLGDAVAVEHRYIEPILAGIEHDGLTAAYH